MKANQRSSKQRSTKRTTTKRDWLSAYLQGAGSYRAAWAQVSREVRS